MRAGAYEILLHILASAATGGGSFLVGIGVGWMFWTGRRRLRHGRKLPRSQTN